MGTIPELVFVAFQMTFACITPALIVGGFAERMKFSAVVLFVVLWVTIVYFPIAHMAWDANGLYFGWGAMDFAGGTVVHINAGVAALVGALVIGPRIGYRKEIMAPHSMTLTMVGSAILWVGWFGFNAGSALSAGGVAALAMMNTFTATAGAIVGWSALEAMSRGKASMLGAASGMVAGLVAVTPAAGFVGPVGAIVLGLVASAFCYFFVQVVKEHFGYDDSLDVFGVHGIGGIVGAIGTGFFASASLGGVGYAEGQTMAGQVVVQLKAVCVTLVWCAVVSFVLYKLVDMIVGLRVAPETEREGLDLAEHGERAYVYVSSVRPPAAAVPSVGRRPAGWKEAHEARHRRHQALQARGGPRGADRRRGHRADGLRGEGLRPPGRPHRDLPRRRVRRELRPQGAARAVVPDEAVPAVMAAVTQGARTGKIGDGKIFVIDVEQALRVRTGETGEDAL